jgi:pyrophosphatase PpaX
MASHKCYSTILFDFDGTLTSSLPLWAQAFQFVLAQFGYQLSVDEVIRKCFYRDWHDIVAEFQLPSVAEFSRLMQIGLEEAFLQAQPYAGALEFLNECCRQNIILGIVTSSRKKLVMRFLETYGITDFFKTIITAEDVDNHKPHPEPILMAISHMDSPVEETILIGDSDADMLAAGAAGIHRALFIPEEHRRYYDFGKLQAHQPEIVFQDYAELHSRLLPNGHAAHDDPGFGRG